MSDFKPVTGLKIGEHVYPIYELDHKLDCEMFYQELPPEIQDNVNANSAHGKWFEPSLIIKNEPIAIVGYGPTLKVSVDALKAFKTIISTSGAHNFLIERGIIPTYHIDVDFRPHKVVHTKDPHPDVKYLFGSTVHPTMLENKTFKLFHIDVPVLKYQPGEPIIKGYWDVGQLAMLVAKEMGYREMHLFGFDYSFTVDNTTHAGFHNGNQGERVFARVNEKLFPTSDSLCRGVLAFGKLVEENPDLKLSVYSNALLTEYMRRHYAI